MGHTTTEPTPDIAKMTTAEIIEKHMQNTQQTAQNAIDTGKNTYPNKKQKKKKTRKTKQQKDHTMK